MAAVPAKMTEVDSFLPALTQSLSELNAQPAMPTAEFCRAMSLILPVFDHLGAPCRPPHVPLTPSPPTMLAHPLLIRCASQ